jgi:hypothetical protein
MIPLAHRACHLSPTGPRSPLSLDDESSRLSVQLNLIRQLRLIEEQFRHANAPGVSDPDDASGGRHVPTL